VKVVIDHDRCTGHGRCYTLEPVLFVDDEAGYGQVIGDGTVAPEHVEAAKRAVAACPERAITIEE
jgi:ferredoxin